MRPGSLHDLMIACKSLTVITQEKAENLSGIAPCSSIPWIVLGIFNKVRSSEERIGIIVYKHGNPSEFIQAIYLAQLMNMPSI